MKKSSLALLALGTLSATPGFAQPTSPSMLAPVTVTGNPLGTTDLIAPTAQYSGVDLLFRSQTTLGETLDGTPGFASTYFGPNASRPIIRGLDGDRVRILSNGAANSDASSLSYDHAVTADPLSMERVEVLRGPAALLYGGNAVGGVVNVIDNRIARDPQFDAKGGVSGKADLSHATGNAANSAALVIEGGNDRFSLHADAFNRTTSDVEVPVELDCTKPGAPKRARKICNSASETRGAALGGTVFFKQGYVGASVSQFKTDYGTVAEDEVTIGMKSDHVAIAGEWRGLSGPVRSVKFHWGRTYYAHTEFEGPDAGTLFKSNGHDMRLEVRHAPLGNLNGVVGVQAESSNFSADGEEAFAPYSNTRQGAVFLYEELAYSWGRLSGGLRAELVSVESLGNPQVDRFVTGTRSFNPASYALGALWNAAPGWQLTTNLAYSERAPKDYELFANGPHIATNAYEIGDAALRVEQSTNLDVGAQWKAGPNRFALSAFVNEFTNYLALQPSGTQENGLDAYAYTQVKARFSGVEASGAVRLLQGAQTLDLELRSDLVRAENANTGEALPRIAPVRLGATLVWAQGPWSARLGANHSAVQTEVPVGQRSTEAYTLWNASAAYTSKLRATEMLWYAKLENITDALAYSASSILTQTASGKAPMPGRTVKVGLRWSF
ncbi:MAG: TonB-dependent receptor [Rhodoferax sp.]|nr:TonB-dependent receptor [Rhodoferax sp.]